MVDVSQARPQGSTSRRSQGVDISPVSPSVRTQATRRAVTTRAAAPSPLGKALGDFFGLAQALGEADHQKTLKTIRANNTKAIEHAEAEVAKRPTEARKAIQTGDYTSFMETDVRDRKVVLDHFRIATAKSMATEDFDNELEAKIQTLPDNVDPSSVLEGWMADKLKGADPVFAAQYANTIAAPARRAVSELRDARIERQTVAALDTAESNMLRGMQSGTVSLTQGGLAASRSTYIGSLPHPSPKAVAIAEARWESDLATAAATGNHQALRMMEIADPGKDGTSIMSRSPELYVQARDAMLSEMQSIQSADHLVAIGNLENAIAEANVNGKENQNFEQLWGQLWAIREQYETPGAESSRWRSLRGMIRKKEVKEVAKSTLWSDMAQNRVGDLSTKEHNLVAMDLYNGGQVAGVDPATSDLLKYRMLATYGSGPDAKKQNSTIMLADADPEQFQDRYDQLKQVHAATPGGDMSNHLSEEAATQFHALMALEDAGLGEVTALRATIRENAPTLGNPETYLQNQLINPGDGESTKFGEAGVAAIAKEAFDNREDPLAGFEEGGKWFGLKDDRTPWDHASDQVKMDHMKAVNQAAFYLAAAGLPRDDAMISDMTNRMMKGRVGYGMDPNGDVILQRNQTPTVQLDPQGHVVPGVRVTKEHIDYIHDQIDTNTDLQGLFAVFAGGPPALVQDQHTSAGAGLAIQLASGIPAAIPAGMTFQVPKAALDEAGNASKFFDHIRTDAGTVTLRSKPVDAADANGRFMITDEIGMIYSETDQAWLPRYWPQPKKGTTTEDLSVRQGVDMELGDADMDTQRLMEAAPSGGVTFASPVPSPDYTPPPSKERTAAQAKLTQQTLRAGQRTGQISPMLNTATIPPDATMDEAYQGAVNTSREQFGDLPSTGVGKKVERQVVSVMNEVNGFNVLPHDARSRRVVPGDVKGADRAHVLVGYGVNMSHPGMDDMLKQVGAVPEKVGRRPIMDQEQASKLSALVMRRDVEWLNTKLPGVTLTNHQLVPLLSLMQSSPWSEDTPKAITPELLSALKAQDYAGAAKVLKSYVPPDTPDHLKAAAETRARRLAIMFSGAQ